MHDPQAQQQYGYSAADTPAAASSQPQYGYGEQVDPAYYDPISYQQWDPTEAANARAEQLERRHIRRLEKDTYVCRRKEGRPKHTTLSQSQCVLSILSFILQLVAIITPQWRIDRYGSFGYGGSKSWGLFSILGRTEQSWQALAEKTCEWWGSMKTFNSCQNPICHWYFVKCRIYNDMHIMSYSVGGMFIIGLIIHAVCIVLTLRMTPKSFRWASIWWTVELCLHVLGLFVHFVSMEELFQGLQNYSFYPDPDLGSSMALSCMSLGMLIIIVILSYALRWTWPEPKEDSEDEAILTPVGSISGKDDLDASGNAVLESDDKAPPLGFEQPQVRPDTRHGDDKAPKL